MNRQRGFIEGFIVVVICGLLLLLLLFLFASFKEHQSWEKFKVDHKCVVIGEMRGGMGVGVGPSMGGNGGMAVVVVSEGNKTGWQCDDGKQYWR